MVAISPPAPSRAAQEATPGGLHGLAGISHVDGVTVTLESTFAPQAVVSFGVPVPPAMLQDASTLGVSLNGAVIDATVKVLLGGPDARAVRPRVSAPCWFSSPPPRSPANATRCG